MSEAKARFTRTAAGAGMTFGDEVIEGRKPTSCQLDSRYSGDLGHNSDVIAMLLDKLEASDKAYGLDSDESFKVIGEMLTKWPVRNFQYYMALGGVNDPSHLRKVKIDRRRWAMSFLYYSLNELALKKEPNNMEWESFLKRFDAAV